MKKFWRTSHDMRIQRWFFVFLTALTILTIALTVSVVYFDGVLGASSTRSRQATVTAPSVVSPSSTAVVSWGISNARGQLVQRGLTPERADYAKIDLVVTEPDGDRRIVPLVQQTADDGRERVRIPATVRAGDRASFRVAVFPLREPVPGAASPEEPRVIAAASSQPALVGRTPFAFLLAPPGGGGGGGGGGGSGGGDGGGGGGGGSGGGGSGGGSGGGGGGGGGGPQPTATPTPVAPITTSNIKAEGSCANNRITVSWTTNVPTYATLHHGPSPDKLSFRLYTQEFSTTKTLHIGYAAYPIQPTWYYQIEAFGAYYLTSVRSDIKSVNAPCAPAPRDTTPPTISGIAAEVLADSIRVSWTNNEPTAESSLSHGPNPKSLAYQLSTQQLDSPKTLYIGKASYPYSSYSTWYYKIRAVDVSRNVTESPVQSIAIPAPVAPMDTTPPTISGIAAEVLADSIRVSWTNNEPTAESYLFHGPDPNSLVYYLYTQELASPKTLYIGKARYPYSSYSTWYYKIRAVDVSRNAAESDTKSVQTGAARAPIDTTPPIIF